MSETMEARSTQSFLVLKENNCQSGILHLMKVAFRNEKEVDIIRQRKTKKFVARRPTHK